MLADHHNTATAAVRLTAGMPVQRRKLTPYGEDRGERPQLWPGQRGFVGGTIDDTTGLVHLGAREYDPAIGRFLSVDPIFIIDDPRQWNPYSYGLNNPVTQSDPSGTCVPAAEGTRRSAYLELLGPRRAEVPRRWQ